MASHAPSAAPASGKMADAQFYIAGLKSRSASSSSFASSSSDHIALTRVPSQATTQSGISSGSSASLIPDYDYPVPLIIKNTFLCADADRLSALEGFYVERRTHSCVSRLEQEASLVEEVEAEVEAPALPEETHDLDVHSELEKLLQDAGDVEAALPSLGSAGHFDGQCKPCAFFHTQGCRQGSSCHFCHLCDASERKKRRKEKINMIRAARMALS